MAKTFKNLPQSEPRAVPKPVSERDFFDLTDDPRPTRLSIATLPATHNSSTTSNTGNTSITDNTDNGDNVGDTIMSSVSTVAASVVEGGDARQTFVLSRSHLEKLRDYVHARRSEGDYNYSQKQALQEALDLLFASAAPVAPRPDQAREREQQRRQRIQQGRRPQA